MSTPGQPPHRPPCPYAPARYYPVTAMPTITAPELGPHDELSG
jgi:hypothetical protein